MELTFQSGAPRLYQVPVYVPPFAHPVYPNVPIDQQGHWISQPYPNPPIANGRPSENDEGDVNHGEEERHPNYPPPTGLPLPVSSMQQQSMYQMMVPPHLNVHGYVGSPLPYHHTIYGNANESVDRTMQNGNRRTKSNKVGDKTNDVQYSDHEANGDITSLSPVNSMQYQPQHAPNYVNMPYSAMPTYSYPYYPQTAAHISAQHATGSPLYVPIYSPAMFSSGPVYSSENTVPVTISTSIPSEECKLTNQSEEFSSVKITDYVEDHAKTVETPVLQEHAENRKTEPSYEDQYASNSHRTQQPVNNIDNTVQLIENNTMKPTRILGHNENPSKFFPKEAKPSCLIDPAIIMSSAPISAPEIINEIQPVSSDITKIANVDLPVEFEVNSISTKIDNATSVIVNGLENLSTEQVEEDASENGTFESKATEENDTKEITEIDELKDDLSEEKSADSAQVNEESSNSSHDTSAVTETEQKPETEREPDPELEPAVPVVKTWAGLFKNGSSKKANSSNVAQNAAVSNTKPFARVEPFQNASSAHSAPNENCFDVTPSINLPSFNTPAPSRQSQSKGPKSTPSNTYHNQLSSSSLDEISLRRVGELLKSYKLDHRAVNFETHGLINRGNSCYINATLQALIACPPFYNLMKSVSYNAQRKGKSSPSLRHVPIIDSIVQLINEFSITHAKQRKEKLQKYEGIIELTNITSLEPTFIHKMLSAIQSSDTFVMGQQEDAQEFLTCLLNGLDDEMLELIQLAEGSSLAQIHNRNSISKKSGEKSSGENKVISNGDIASETDDNDSEWKEVQAKNKSAVTYRQNIRPTPISAIFRGQMRSRLQKAGDQSTNNIEPFFTLHLNIEKVHSVKDALELLVGRDALEGVTSSRTNQEVDAWQQQTLEELPYVLLLHLKCFDYKNHSCSKIIKTIEFPIDLRLDSKVMSQASMRVNKPVASFRHRQYKLFAVVYHDGKEATKGHYITDVFHVGYSGWIRYDDAKVYVVEEKEVLKPKLPRMPYLLYYRRCDTIAALMQPPFNK